MSKKFLIIGFVVLILFGIGGTKLFLNSKASRNTPVEKVQDASPILEIFAGDVEVKLSAASDFSKASDGQKVDVGTVVKTGSDGRAQIVYPTNSVTRIDFNSQMVIEEFTKSPSVTKVKVNNGRIWSRVAKLFGKDDSNETETNTLVASVRGTSYGLGILADGSNRIAVTKSHVYVECHEDSNKNTDVSTNNKIITKCTGKLTELQFDNKDINDEWTQFNKDQDAKLDVRFPGSYDDSATPTPTATAKQTPAVKGIATTAPTAKPTPTPTPAPTSNPTSSPTPTGTPTPTPNFSITRVSVSCNNNTSRTSQTSPCGDVGYSLGVSISGNGFDSKLSPGVNLINTNGGANLSTNNLSYDGNSYVLAKFSSSGTGTYEVHYIQNNQDVKYSETITLP